MANYVSLPLTIIPHEYNSQCYCDSRDDLADINLF